MALLPRKGVWRDSVVVTGKAQRRLSALLKAVALGACGFGGNTTGPCGLASPSL